MEDDWNDGQAYVVKTTHKGGDAEYTTTSKVAEPKGDAHKVALEAKNKWTSKAYNGFVVETKLKNSGEVYCDGKSDYLKQFEGFEDVRLLSNVQYNTKALPMAFGFSYMPKTFKFDTLIEVSGNNKMITNWSWRATDWMNVACTKQWANVTDPMNNIKWTFSTAGHVNKSTQWGWSCNGNSPTIQETAIKDHTCYVQHEAGKYRAGAQLNYNFDKKAYDHKLGLMVKEDDHTWKFRLHNSGVARAALQWQMHKVCKTTVNTSVDMGQALKGNITGMPIGV